MIMTTRTAKGIRSMLRSLGEQYRVDVKPDSIKVNALANALRLGLNHSSQEEFRALAQDYAWPTLHHGVESLSIGRWAIEPTHALYWNMGKTYATTLLLDLAGSSPCVRLISWGGYVEWRESPSGKRGIS